MAFKKIGIPQPCSQKYGQMQPKDGGRLCTSCNTVIMDFSSLSDEELIKTLQTGQYHCGRFSNEQLEKIYYIEETRKERKKYWTAIAASIIAGTLQISTSFAQTTQTQRHTQTLYSRSTVIAKYNTQVAEDGTPAKNEPKKDQITIRVIDEKTKTGVGSAYINIEDWSAYLRVDENGIVNIDIPANASRDQWITLHITDWRYKDKTLKIKLSQWLNQEKLVTLHKKKHPRNIKRMGVVAYDF